MVADAAPTELGGRFPSGELQRCRAAGAEIGREEEYSEGIAWSAAVAKPSRSTSEFARRRNYLGVSGLARLLRLVLRTQSRSTSTQPAQRCRDAGGATLGRESN